MNKYTHVHIKGRKVKFNSVQTGYYLGVHSIWMHHVSFINLTECILQH